jgi:hypothetical protein
VPNSPQKKARQEDLIIMATLISTDIRSSTFRSFSRLLLPVALLLGATAIPSPHVSHVLAAAPSITNVSANGILTASATVAWTTDVAADSQVEYGLSANYGASTTLDANLVTAHSQNIGGLQANTMYHYRVKSRDNTGNLALSADSVFITAMGYSTAGPLLDVGDFNVMNANRFVTTAGGKVVSLSAHVGTVGAAPNSNKYQMALYNEASGAPGTLVASTAVGNLTANAWNTLPLTTTPVLAPNTAYYIVYNTNGGNSNLNNLHYMNTSSWTVKWRTQTFGTYPNTFGALTSQEMMTQSVYASFVPVDSTPPTVAITAPTGGTVTGTVTVTADAGDDTGVTSVQFKRGNTNLGVPDVAPPYSVSWDTTLAISGNESLTAVATDAAGNSTVSAPVTVVTANPSNVRITQPTSGQVIASTDVTVKYEKGGNIVSGDGQHAHLRLDGGPTKMDLDFDGTYLFSGVPAGDHTIEIIVADANHVEQPGSGQTISFSNTAPDVTPPTVSITAPTDGATVSSTITVRASAGDTGTGVAKVQFWLDGSRMLSEATTGNPDYTSSLDTTTIGNGSHTLMARAFDNSFNQADSANVSVNVQNLDPRANVGEWGAVIPLPIVPVHASLLHTGEILMWDAWDSTSPPRLWNMQSNTFTAVPVPQIGDFELFCAGQATTGTGELVVAGGHGTSETGIKNIYMFNPDTRTWTRKADMRAARWYPSVTQMSDNRMTIIGGQINNHIFAEVPEIFDPKTNTIEPLLNINTSQVNEVEYPQSTMLPGGKIMSISAEHGPIMIFDPDAKTWTQIGTTQVPFGAWTSFAPGKYLITGGGVFIESQQGAPSQKIAKVLDMTSGSPVWTDVPDMSETRSFHNVTMLPNGKAMVIGGSHIVQDSAQPDDAAYSSQIWDPATNTWAPTATMSQPRMYHSVSMLLPDGRVLSAGGGRLNPAVDQLNAQIYSPGYLFRGPRPTITSAPDTAQHNSTMNFDTPDAASITKVTLSSLASVTHTADWNQHFMELSFTRNGNTLTINTPSNSKVIPEGYYMIFLVNSDGVPSQAKIVRLATPDTTAPTVGITAPANNATVSGTLNVTANATDNIGVTGVQFKLDGSNLGAEDTSSPFSVSWNTAQGADGPHTLTAVARDLAGNVTTSPAVAVTVQNADSTPPTVSLTAPANGATVSSSINVTATASDNIGVAGVQFKLDGSTLGAEDTTSPYGVAWDTSSSTNGTHTLTAVARDAAGNQATATSVSVTVSNGGPDVTPPTISAIQSTTITSSGATITWTTNENADTQVEYGTTTSYGSSTTLATGMVTSHSQGLSGLNASTLYHFRVKSRDAAGNLATSADNTFTTSATANSGLVAAYNFNAGSGTALTDSSGNNNQGTIVQATWTTSGKFGSALNFDGVNDIVNINHSSSLNLTNAFTVEAWVRPSNIGGWRSILMKEISGNQSFSLYASDGPNSPAATYANVKTEVSARGGGNLPVDTWTHVAGTYGGGSLKLYINGSLVNTRSLTGNLKTSTNPMRIGGNTIWSDEYFAGQIDEVRVYNRTLTQAEIQANMNQAL